VVPVYNGADYLGAAVESILAQTYLPCEIIVVDDGSTDESAAIIQRLAAAAPVPIRSFHQANRGVAAARNMGVAAASGSWIAFLDQDDVWLPAKLARQVAALKQQPDLGCVTVKQRFFLTEGFERPYWVRPELLERDLAGYTPSALLVKRALFSQLGRFDETIEATSDTDWIARAVDAGVLIGSVDEALLLHRIHPANQSRFVATAHAEFLKIARRSVERKQGRG